MRRRVALAGTLAIVVAGLITAPASALTDYVVRSDATANKAGSKGKPARFVASFAMKATGHIAGQRADAPDSFTYRWKGVRSNGGAFPTCSADQIDAMQSDSVCPPGSLIATAPFTAAIGVENDPNSILACYGKTLRIYNNGPDAETWFMV